MSEECTPEFCATVCANIAYWQAAMAYDQAAYNYDQSQYYMWQMEKYRCSCNCGMMASAPQPKTPNVTAEDVEKARLNMEEAKRMRDEAKSTLDALKDVAE